MIRLKRVYEEPASDDGVRVLIDRLWPRGLSKERAKVSMWVKQAGPSTELRKWFDHDPERWEEFKARYFAELEQEHAQDALQPILELVSEGRCVTLLFGSRETRFNNAVALREYMENRL